MAGEISVEESHVGPVVRPADDSGMVILYLHDEAGNPQQALGTAERLTVLTGATTVCPRYRPGFPAALIDAHSGYSHGQAAGPVVVIGEGIGAALATAMMMQLRDSEATPPRGAVLLSALLDLSLETKSLLFNASTDPRFDITALRRRIADYARGVPLTDARLSPLYANLHGLPAVQLLVAGTDPLLDDSLAFATRAARSRVAVDLHVWPETDSFRDEAITAMAAFVKQVTLAPRAGAAA
ncbi:alpha/beta hydrolase [Saccharomonospora sp. NPDC046836]|uniref:alpha/beta hydrolase n=1 Tax=Saccharomonospora sp. NPDC046836 TaxID=3156921 RepID=UPI0033CCDA38